MKKLEELNTKYNIEAYYECNDGWYETLCDKHYEERERRKYKQTFDYIMSKPDAVELFQDIMWSKQEQVDKLLDRLKKS